MANKLVTLCILDGWGYRESRADNAVAQAATPRFDHAWANNPHCFLRTDGEHVGLPEGQFGNSEVGHMNLGAGRVVFQDLPRITHAIADGTMHDAPAFKQFADRMIEAGGRVHVIGLLSDGGVHAHQDHMVYVTRLLDDLGIPCRIHAVLDGRDTAPQSGADFLSRFSTEITGCNNAKISTVCGRFFSMDRDKRWDRTERAYALMVSAKGHQAGDFANHLKQQYRTGSGDEFIEPAVDPDYDGMRDGDGLICLNFRADRCRQILDALVDPAFDGFKRSTIVRFADRLGMVPYSGNLDQFLRAWFPAQSLDKTLGEVIAGRGLPQTRMAETEKYPHVTFFFNGGREKSYNLEDRVLVPSPKVLTYDLKPEMSAVELTDAFCRHEQDGGFILINFANPDMVGHTGDLTAAVNAVETVDACLGRVIDSVRQRDGVIIVTADHGNCEMMRDPVTGGPHTAHTTNPVPCIALGLDSSARLHDGRLADIAPTILAILGIEQPPEMTGAPLLDRAS